MKINVVHHNIKRKHSNTHCMKQKVSNGNKSNTDTSTDTDTNHTDDIKGSSDVTPHRSSIRTSSSGGIPLEAHMMHVRLESSHSITVPKGETKRVSIFTFSTTGGRLSITNGKGMQQCEDGIEIKYDAPTKSTTTTSDTGTGTTGKEKPMRYDFILHKPDTYEIKITSEGRLKVKKFLLVSSTFILPDEKRTKAEPEPDLEEPELAPKLEPAETATTTATATASKTKCLGLGSLGVGDWSDYDINEDADNIHFLVTGRCEI